MNALESSASHAAIVETELQFSTIDLGRICGIDVQALENLVHEGVLMPLDLSSPQWVFSGAILPRARKATRLLVELELNAAAVALVIDLMDEIGRLRSQIARSPGWPDSG